MSHFWENPSFIDDNEVPQQENFQQQVIDILDPGDGTDGFPGISQFVGPGGCFGPDTHTAAIIITPRDWANPIPGNL